MKVKLFNHHGEFITELGIDEAKDFIDKQRESFGYTKEVTDKMLKKSVFIRPASIVGIIPVIDNKHIIYGKGRLRLKDDYIKEAIYYKGYAMNSFNIVFDINGDFRDIHFGYSIFDALGITKAMLTNGRSKRTPVITNKGLKLIFESKSKDIDVINGEYVIKEEILRTIRSKYDVGKNLRFYRALDTQV